ncbi:MAG: membrane protein insertase YidC [Acidobacteria bacterium]|nr:membrane protein insertase YidC [Acidobacteriota bacterium]
MEKRVILALLLSFAIITAYQYFLRKIYPPPPPSKVERIEHKAPVVPPAPRTFPPLPAAEVTQAEKKDIAVEGALYRAVFSTQGAAARSWQLKAYTEEVPDPADPNKKTRVDYELIPHGLPPGQGFFSLGSTDPSLDEKFRKAVYEVSSDPPRQGVVKPPAKLIFRHRGPDFYAEKTFEFSSNGYETRFHWNFHGTNKEVQLDLGPGLGREIPEPAAKAPFPRVAWMADGKVERTEPHKIEGTRHLSGSLEWLGLETKYFLGAVLPQGASRASLAQRTWEEKGPEKRQHRSAVVSLPLSPGTYRIYMGPKDYDILSRVQPSLTQVIDYGFFAFVVRPLLFSLKFIYKYVGNYGLAIIVLTFVLNLLLYPIRHKQMSSMQKMQKLQPKIKAIQEKYKKFKRTDPQRQKMNAEIMELYKAHGVNPLGGCLPLVLQMPILFAFYQLLDSSIELRGAPFLMWIRDLSQKDPLYVAPVLMGATMLWQQRMTPSPAADPVQNKMMMMMPIFFTFLFLNMSAGLNLYFFFSTLFGIGQQLLMQRYAIAHPDEQPKGKSKKKTA